MLIVVVGILGLSVGTFVFLDKKHVKFDQGPDFPNFSDGNRGENQEKPQKHEETIRKN